MKVDIDYNTIIAAEFYISLSGLDRPSWQKNKAQQTWRTPYTIKALLKCIDGWQETESKTGWTVLTNFTLSCKATIIKLYSPEIETDTSKGQNRKHRKKSCKAQWVNFWQGTKNTQWTRYLFIKGCYENKVYTWKR